MFKAILVVEATTAARATAARTRWPTVLRTRADERRSRETERSLSPIAGWTGLGVQAILEFESPLEAASALPAGVLV